MNQAALAEVQIIEAATIRLKAALQIEIAIPPVVIPPVVVAPPPLVRKGFPNEAGLAKFFDAVRAGKALGPTLSADEVEGCQDILAACTGFPLAWAAYPLATAVVETAGTMQPIKERGGNAYFTRMYDVAGDRPDKARELGNIASGDGALYCGRGYIQLTGKNNYARAEAKLRAMGLLLAGESLVSNPDMALRHDVAAAIMRYGMQEGWFTGKSLSSYLLEVGDIHSFTNARRIINGQDRAIEIAGYALEFQAALVAGGWV